MASPYIWACCRGAMVPRGEPVRPKGIKVERYILKGPHARRGLTSLIIVLCTKRKLGVDQKRAGKSVPAKTTVMVPRGEP